MLCIVIKLLFNISQCIVLVQVGNASIRDVVTNYNHKFNEILLNTKHVVTEERFVT